MHDPPDPAPPLLLPRMCSWTFAWIYSIPARWVLLEAARFSVTIGEAVKGRSSRSKFDKDALWGRQLCRDVERLVQGHLLGSLLLHTVVMVQLPRLVHCGNVFCDEGTCEPD